MAIKEAVQTTVVSQFHRPHGFLGRVAGWIMGTRSSNVQRNRWAVETLDVQPDDRVLEIGFGPGIAIEALAARVTTGTVTGVDHSELMVSTAAARNAAAVRDGRVTLCHGSVEDIDASVAPLDVILAVNNLGMWPDPPAQLRAFRDLLEVGGRIAIGSQPRHSGADAEGAVRAGAEITELLSGAGFTAIEQHRLDLSPPMMLIVGVRGATAGSAHSP